MPNTNCLEDLACPECGEEAKLHVVARVWVEVTDDGADSTADGLPDYDTEWDDDSKCQCPECEFNGKLRDFCKPKKRKRK